jgi:hypothetical protein
MNWTRCWRWPAKGMAELRRIGNQHGGRVGFFLQTDDFWRDHARLDAGGGVEFLESPREESYATVAVFRDATAIAGTCCNQRNRMKLVLASSNQGKLEELRGLLAGTGIELVAQSSLAWRMRRNRRDIRRERDPQGTPRRLRITGLPQWPMIPASAWMPCTARPGCIRRAMRASMATVRAISTSCSVHCRAFRKQNARALLLRAGAAAPCRRPAPLIVEGRWHGRILHERRGTAASATTRCSAIPPAA